MGSEPARDAYRDGVSGVLTSTSLSASKFFSGVYSRLPSRFFSGSTAGG
jgi:hypothetical protein